MGRRWWTVLGMLALATAARTAHAAPTRWSPELPARPEIVAWSGFDPALHTPNFSNDQDVSWNERAGDALREHRYRGGLCWGICELAHLYFRELTSRALPDAIVRDALYRCVFGSLPPPVAGAAGRNLRLLCETSPTWRERVCAVAAALQLDSPEDHKIRGRDARALAEQILRSIRADGSAILYVQRVDPLDGDDPVAGHNLLAYAAGRGFAVSGARRKPVIVIRAWDPLWAFPTRAAEVGAREILADRGQPANPDCALLYDPTAGTLTFSADYLRRKAFHAPDPRAGRQVLQPGESLVPGRDLYLRWPPAPMAARILEAAIGTTKRTRLAADPWPRGPVAMLEPAE